MVKKFTVVVAHLWALATGTCIRCGRELWVNAGEDRCYRCFPEDGVRQ